MIEKLTEEQEAMLPVYRDKWIAIGRNTEPANRPVAEEGINWAYRNQGFEEPFIIWTLSPLENIYAQAVMQALENKRGKGELNAKEWEYEYNTFLEKIVPALNVPPDTNIWTHIYNLVKTKPNFSDLIKMAKECVNVDAAIDNSVYGQHEAHWLAFYEFFHDVCGLVEETKELTGLWMYGKNAGWMLAYEGLCIVAERHNELHFDENDRLHNPVGASILFPDGLDIYHWNGVRVPKKVIMTPELLTKEDFISENNAEIRRAMIATTDNQILGKLDLRLVDSNPDPELGSLYEYNFTDTDVIKVLKLQNSTPEPGYAPRADGTYPPEAYKFYWIHPKPGVMTIEEAHSSIARETPFPTIKKLQWA